MYDIFVELLKKKGVRPFDVSKATGISSAILTDWKYGRYTPKMDKMQKIADYFGVSLEYLMTGKEQEKLEGYYIDDDAKDFAQFLFENPEYRVLFDATRKVKKEDIHLVAQLIDRLR